MPLTRATRLLLIALPLGAACSEATLPADTTGFTGIHPDGVLGSRVTGFSGRPFGVRVSAKGLVYVTQQDANSVVGFTLAAPTSLLPAIAVGDDPGEVVFNRAGTAAYVSAYYGGGVHVIDVATGKQTSTIPISSNAYRLALSSDEGRLFVSTVNGALYAVPTRGLTVTTSVQLGGALQGLALSRSGQTLFVASTQGVVWRVDPATLAVLSSKPVAGALQDVAVSPDERELYVADEAGLVHVLDASSLAEVARIDLSPRRPFGLAVTPDGTQLYVTSPATGEVAIVDARTRATIRTLTVSGLPRRVAFSADGRTAVVANEGNWVDVIK
ncbi:MAG: hypothetical protein JWL95_1630 [Gemmatimonadetes bacterium]|nr:hypothetical protein [Gemmatimonadota bacterium]